MDNKHVFWLAFLVALLVFLFGILLGLFVEDTKTDDLYDFYFDSQTDLSDFELSLELFYGSYSTCGLIKNQSVAFADDIYAEAVKLEKYDESNKLTSEIFSLHRRYDLLRTLLWKDIIKSKKSCNNINTVVYLYEYNDPPLTIEGTQRTMRNFLLDLKSKQGDNIILIPIAVDTNIDSLNILREDYNLTITPVILVNENFKVESLDKLDEIESYLN